MGNMRERLCKQVYDPPYETTARAFTFVMRGQGTSIDTKVNAPALKTDYTTSNIVTTKDLFAVSWVHYTNFASTSPAGKFAYNESALFNLVDDGAGVKHLYIPSLYLDSSAAITSGRDCFGFPKAYGTVAISATVPTVNLTLGTEADELATAGGPAAPRRIYSAAAGAGASVIPLPNPNPDDVDAFLKPLEDALKPIFAATPLGADVIELFKILAFWKAPLVLLKQVPSAQTPAQSAYQSYVIAQAGVKRVRSVAWLNGFEVTINDWHSAPIASSYGVPAGTAQTPLLGFFVDLDATIATVSETII